MVGQLAHLFRDVADVDDGDIQFAMQRLDPGQDFLPAFPVHRGQWFVHQQQPGADGQCAGNGHPLAFAPGKRGGPALQQRADAEQRDRAFQRDSAIARRHAFEPVREVAAHRQMLEQAGFLEHVTNGSAVWREKGVGALPQQASDFKIAFRVPVEAGKGPQQGSLAATGRPEQGRDTAAGQVQARTDQEIVQAKLKTGLDGHARSTLSRRFSA